MDVGGVEARGAVCLCLDGPVPDVDALSFRIEALVNRVRPGMEQPYALALVLEGLQGRERNGITVLA